MVAFITYRYSSGMYIREIENGLKHEAVLISYMLKDIKKENINDGFLAQISDVLISHDKESENVKAARRITIIDENGTVLADSYGKSSEMANHANRAEVKQALSAGTGVDVRKSDTTGLNLIYVAYHSKELSAVVRISASVDHIRQIRDTILLYEVLALLIAIGISVFVALKLSNYAIKPISALLKKYGRSNVNQDKRHKDEVGQLSYTLSSMTYELENIIKELKDRNLRVATIINSMSSGLIAVDREMHIIMINPIAYRLFDTAEKPNQAGIPLVQVIRNRQLNDLLLKTVMENEITHQEIYLYQGGKRILSLHASPIYPEGGHDVNSGALAFIDDITQLRKLEEMRTEFVSNVTHELKTPLTSIQGFVETLKTGAVNDPKVAGKFLDIIDIEADRLRMLINDILSLSEIENIKQDNEKQLFELFPLAEEVESMLANAAQDKGISINLQINPDLRLEANRHRIKQLLINLMDNAIKYNKPGGNVTVSAHVIGNSVEIHVRDTGIGIPENHTDRIFERFYRVDKGRSREMGGTGLGLSIVKHIAQLYGGSVHVVSEEGKGSDFIVKLPAARASISLTTGENSEH
jgi:two-component system phosphate regulon sensor histidine kinase PhoR